MRYQYILFDLDGTLTESGEGIKKSALYAIEKLGYPAPPDAVMDTFIGPPLYVSFRDAVHMAQEDVPRAVEYYRERFSTIGWMENRVYPGIPALLKSLKQNGAYVAVATAKPQKFADMTLEYFGLAPFLDRVVGVSMDNTKTEKTALIERALPEGADRSRACMVGDRLYDMEAAKTTGLFPVGAGYGYGSVQELVRTGAEWVARNVSELQAFLLGDSPMAQGRFITFEGTDGCGKSTQIKLVASWLKTCGYEVTLTREPGGCPIAERIRDVVLDVKSLGMTAECEALLFAAARAQHVRDAIIPALKQGNIVMCDRFLDSSIAYQAHGRELGEPFIRQINAPALRNCAPELTLYFDIDADTAKSRVSSGKFMDRIEIEQAAYFDRVKCAYEEILRAEPARVKRIDANQPISRVFESTKECVWDFLLDKE